MSAAERSVARQRGEGHERLLALAAWGGACLLFALCFTVYRPEDAWFAQNDHNLLFTRQPTLGAALVWSQKTWPPLYPVLLWLWARAGLALDGLNEVLWFGVLAVTAVLARRSLAVVRPGWVLLLAAVFGPHALIAHQRTAEALFALLALLSLERLSAYHDRPSARGAAWVGLAAAGAAMSRYFGVLWLFPVLGLTLLWAGRALPTRRRLRHAVLFAGIAALPVGLWLGWVRAETGYLTGIDRTDATRLAAVQALTGLRGNVEMTAKTVWIDTASDHDYARARRQGYRSDAWDVASWIVFALVLVGLSVEGIRRVAARPPTLRAELVQPEAGTLLASSASYLLVLVAVWTVSNNDPINTRFLLPVYPFLILSGFALYDAWRRAAPGRFALLLVRGGFAWILLASLLRHARGAGLL